MLDVNYLSVALFAVFASLIYLFLFGNLSYWRKRGVRTAKSYPLIGSFPSAFTQKRNVGYDVDDIYRKYKNEEHFVGVFTTRAPQLLILKPEYIHKIYVNDFKNFHDNEFSRFADEKTDVILANNPFALTGEKWKERRFEIVTGMTPNRIKAQYPVTLSVCQRLLDYIRKQSKIGGKDGVDTVELCMRYTSEVVTEAVLGVQAESFSENPTPIFQYTKRLFDQTTFVLIYQFIVGLFPAMRKFYKMRFFPKDVERFFFDLMQQSIDLRRSQNIDRSDFLSYLLQLREKKNMTTGELSSHVMTYLVDGFLTTALTISHCLLLLARNPSAQQRLREEILKHSNEEGHLDFETLSELPYLDACIHESLRIFPAALFVNKLCTSPYDLVNKNGKVLHLQKNDVLIISAYSIHHDSEHYEDPEAYKPERFLPENGGVKKYRDQGLYFGFGDGPRICLGMRFALTQSKAAIAAIVKEFNVETNPKTRTDNVIDKTSFLSNLDGGVYLNFESIH